MLVIITTTSSAGGQTWTPLFDGQSFSGWTTQAGERVKSGAWSIADGMLHLDTSNGRGGNLLTDREFGDFELIFDWNIPDRANNGIKYRVQDFDGRILGLEYQIIDDEGHGNLTPRGMTATLYDIQETIPHAALNPPGQWNRGRIVVRGDQIEHWLNGQLVVQAQVGSEDWNARIADSKFNDVEGFGRNRSGKIMLTEHNDEIWYRNIFVREPPAAEFASPHGVTIGACNVACVPPEPCPTRTFVRRFQQRSWPARYWRPTRRNHR